MTQDLELTFASREAAKTETVALTDLIIGGWTGRDRAKLEEHIVELEAIGVAVEALPSVCFARSSAFNPSGLREP